MKLGDYECKTTFWQDFMIADAFGESAIRDTFNRAFKEWREDRIYVTELAMVLNWRSWYWDSKDNLKLCKLYAELYYTVWDWVGVNLTDEDARRYFYKTLD